jgi:hypothetical protein
VYRKIISQMSWSQTLKIHLRGAGEVPQQLSICLAYMRPWHTLKILSTTKEEKKKNQKTLKIQF